MVATPEDTYEVLNLIGKGSFGEIRKVRRHRDGAILCRKEIWWRKMNQRERDQLAAEIKILRDLQHKNIVRYITETVDQETKMVYIYMEYCGNGDLHELIQTRKETSPVVRFGEHTVWQIFSQLVLALYRCHNGIDPPPIEDITNPSTLGQVQVPQPRVQSIVLHRDVKPQNVFLDHNNRVKLGDFGLSKEVHGHNLAETYVGTPFYMSPEIIAGRAYNAKSDIWALGCVIFEMCAFEPPFVARDQEELNRKIKLGMVASITRFGYSEALNSAIQSCLRQDERQRPSAAGLLKRPEIIIARQQSNHFDREELLLEREAALVAREKEIERVICSKTEEFRAREEGILLREQRLQKLETHQEAVVQDSTQRKLSEACHYIERMTEEKARLEQKVIALESMQNQNDTAHESRPLLHHAHHSDFLSRPQTILDTDMAMDPFSADATAVAKRSLRPAVGRAQTELTYKSNDDPLHLQPKATTSVRPDSAGRSLRSPQRRKSQIPMSRIRPDNPAREPLSDQPAGVQGLTRALSKQDLSRVTTGVENIRPHSATGMIDKNALMAPRTPTRDLAMRTSNSPRRMAYASPTRATARTLFADSAVDLRRENQRPAPPIPSHRANTLLEGMQKAKLTRDSRHLATSFHDEDDLPSPYLKRAYNQKSASLNQ